MASKDLHDQETLTTDPWTGGQKGKKLTQLLAIDPLALIEVARVAGYGSLKYDRMNYMRGYPWSLSLDAMMRHILLFANGEMNDPESGLNHMGHAAWHALALVSFAERGLGTDDRVSILLHHAQSQDEFPDHADMSVDERRVPSCCEYACYEDPGCECDGCKGSF